MEKELFPNTDMAETYSSETLNFTTQDETTVQSTTKLDEININNNSESDGDVTGIYSSDMSNLTTPEDSAIQPVTTLKDDMSTMELYEFETDANDKNLSSSSSSTINIKDCQNSIKSPCSALLNDEKMTETNNKVKFIRIVSTDLGVQYIETEQNVEDDINDQNSDIFNKLIKFEDDDINEENELAKINDVESSQTKSTFKGKKKADNTSYLSGNKFNDTNMTSDDELFEDGGIVTTIFHVMMPKSLNKNSMVFVIGNIKELGEGRYGTIQLKMHEKYPMLWHSDPINISISILKNRSIQYKYFIYEEKDFFTKIFSFFKKSIFENKIPDIYVETKNWYHDEIDREFISKENQYDIWFTNENFSIDIKDLELKYPYFSIINQSVTEINLKDKIIEYQELRRRHRNYLNYNMLESFIFKEFNTSSIIEQKIFLGVLLGYLIKEKIDESYMPNGYILPEKFPSNDMLQAFKNINVNDLPHGVVKILTLAVCTLVNHISTYSANFEWMNVFEIAPIVDPGYSFLRHVKVPVYRKNISEFKESLQNVVKPYIDNIKNDTTYAKVCKRLIVLCWEIDAIVFLWQSIFRPGLNKYEGLEELLLDHLNYFISNDNARKLETHLEEIPYDLDIDFASRFRGRIYELLNSSETGLDKNNINSMFDLLNNDKLNWQKDSALRALELISNSKNFELLELFPEQLVKFCDAISIDIDLNDTKFCNICAQWLNNTLNRIEKARNKSNTSNVSKRPVENFACTAFSYLSVIYQIMVKCGIAHAQLFKTTEEIVDRLADDVIFDAALDIGNFKLPELVEIFSHVLKRRFGSNVKYSDDQLLVKIIKICKSERQQLHIPNALCEDVVSHILTRLQKNIQNVDMDEIDEKDIIDDDLHKLLLASSKFWIYILKATGSVELLNQHAYVRTVQSTDKQNYLSDLSAKLKMQEVVTLDDTFQKSFWKFHQPILEVGQRSYAYGKSQTFKNVFEKCLETNEPTLTVKLIATKYIFVAFSDYDRLRAEYNEWSKLECLNISPFWKDVKNIDHELELMSRGMKWQPNDDIKKAINCLINFKSWKEGLEDLERTLGAFRVQNVTESWVIDIRNMLLKEPLTLLDLSKISNITNKYIYDFNDNCWAMIGALSYAGDFISWLQMIAEGDLRNLINGVDDKREIHEETVASLIEVKQFLKPLMNDMVKLSKEGKSTHIIITKFLDHIREINLKNESLHEKISHCCSSNIALQNIYFSIVNRGEATKERIRDAATKGLYKFYRDKDHDKCIVNLHCQDKSGKINSYDLSDLQDLQGQALLIAKQAASAFVLRLPVGNENSLEQGTKELMEFVHQIDTVHQIIKYTSKLMELGHFAYREW
ncbi:18274_t:CDS:2, partial [Dentiscutata erythropus]